MQQPVATQLPAQRGVDAELRTVHVQRHASNRWMAAIQLADPDSGVGRWTVTCCVLLDRHGRPVACAEVTEQHFVESKKIPQLIDLDLQFGSLPGDPGPLRVLPGLVQKVIGRYCSVPMLYGNPEPLFSIERMLASPDERVWSAGLTAIFDTNSRNIVRMNQPRGSFRRQWLARDFAPFQRDFERLFQCDASPDALAKLCRLAGHSGDQRYAMHLIRLLRHNDQSLRDSAAIGLGLLGDPREIARIEAVAATESEHARYVWHSSNDARSALDVLLGDSESQRRKLDQGGPPARNENALSTPPGAFSRSN